MPVPGGPGSPDPAGARGAGTPDAGGAPGAASAPGAAGAPDPGETEASLVARAQAGDVAAFERLSGAYADRLFMLLLRLLGDHGEAEDVAQEVMLRAWRGIAGFRGRSSYFTWLTGSRSTRPTERWTGGPASRPV